MMSLVKRVSIGLLLIILMATCRKSESSRPAPSFDIRTLDLKFVRIPAGEFEMGSDSPNAFDQNPLHHVTIRRPFELETTEVTQAQWTAVMGNNPSHFRGDNLPVDQVSWNDAQEFISRLNANDPGKNYRLPTEAEWEYACRAGTTEPTYGDIDAIAWYNGNSEQRTHPWARRNRTRGACMTCWEMCGSLSPTGKVLITRALSPIPRDRRPATIG
jgi:formylglycine-generating enzyme required for sulfatase activity